MKVRRLKIWLLCLGSLYLVVLLSLLLLHRRLEVKSGGLGVSAPAPARVKAGEPFELLVQGTGFDRHTRVSMVHEVGRREAILHEVPTWGRLESLALADGVVYLANRYRGLQAIDLASGDPKIIDSLTLPGQTWGVAAVADRAYLVNRTGLLQIVDTSRVRSEGMRVMSSLRLDGHALDVCLAGRTALVANSKAGLQAVDITDPGQPRLLSVLPLAGNPYSVAVAGDRAFVAAAAGGLQIVDIRDPSRMRVIGSLQESSIFGVDVRDGIAYLAAGTRGLLVADVRDGARPRVIGACNLIGSAFRLLVSGDRVYVAASAGGLQVVDVSDPAAPAGIGSYSLPGSTTAVLVEQGRALVTTDERFFLIDLDRPASLRPEILVDLGIKILNLLPEGDRLYLSGQNEIHIFEWDGPDRLRRVGMTTAPERVGAILKKDDVLYILSRPILPTPRGTLLSLSLSDPERLETVTLLEKPEFISCMAIAGSTFFLGDKRGIEWYRIETEGLRRLGRSEVGGGIKSMGVLGGLLFAGGHEGDFHVFSLEDDGGLQRRGSYSLPSYLKSFSGAKEIAFKDGFALVADGRNGLLTFDLQDPERPVLAGALQVEGYAEGMSIEGSWLYLSDTLHGLQVVDIRDPRRPQVVATLATASFSRRPCISAWSGWIVYDCDTALVASPLPTELTDVSRETGRLRIRGRAPEQPGTYSLRLFNAREGADLPAVLIVEPRPDPLSADPS